MSEYAIEEKREKKKRDGAITVEKMKLADLPDSIQSNRGKYVGVLRTVNDTGLSALMTNPWAIFESPLTQHGFESAGENAIGLVIQPRARGPIDNLVRALTNSSTVLNAWGHTALYVRIDGVIQRVIGFDPYKISTDVILRGDKVTTGKLPTAGHYNDDSALFQNNSARSIEYAVPRKLARQILESMPHHGAAKKYPKQMQEYIGSPGKYLEGKAEELRFTTGNCISYAMNTINKELGADIYAIHADDKNADTAVIDLGGKLMANQGVLSRNLLFVEKKQKKTLVLRWTHGKQTYEILPTLGSMPTSFVVIKGLGHVYLLTSVARFTTPMITSLLPSPLYGMVPSAPWLLQSGIMARADTFNALTTAFDTLADQYISKEAMRYLHQIGMLVGTAYILYSSDDRVAEIVYGAMSAVLPYILEWLAEGTHRMTGM